MLLRLMGYRRRVRLLESVFGLQAQGCIDLIQENSVRKRLEKGRAVIQGKLAHFLK